VFRIWRSGDGFDRFHRLIGRVSDDVGREFVLGQHLGRRRDDFPHADRKYIGHGIEGGHRGFGAGVASVRIGLKDVNVLAVVLIALDGLAKRGGHVVARRALLDLCHISVIGALVLEVKRASTYECEDDEGDHAETSRLRRLAGDHRRSTIGGALHRYINCGAATLGTAIV